MRNVLLTGILLIAFKAHAQEIATIEADMRTSTGGLYVPVSVNLDAITFLPDSVLTLVEKRGGQSISIPFQIEQGDNRTLIWLIEPQPAAAKKRSFVLMHGRAGAPQQLAATRQDGALTIHAGNQNLLRYQYGMIYPPKGIDTVFKRNAFIHPLWTPHGQQLTRIQPRDHYHHYGIWNPWTHVLYKNDTVDFWNLGSKQGTVRFAGFASVTEGPVFSGFDALHDHVVLKQGNEEVAIKETQSVRVYKPESNPDAYIADFTIQLSCATENPVLLLEYRYGGFGWRTTEKWDNQNSEVITSEGKTRKDADGSKATWCIVQGALDNDYGGVVMMSYPTNYNHPEPLRIWPENMNKRGDLFANFSPTKDMNWLLEPGKKYVLKYRLLVFNNKLTKENAAAAWQYFAQPPALRIIKK